MIRAVKFFGFILVALVAMANTANAQWTTLTYNQYGISFKAPTDFTVSQNDASGYIASGADFTMEIYPWKDASITEPVSIAQAMYDEMTNVEDKEIVEQGPITLTGFEGHWVVGTGTQDGKVLVYALGGYLNPENETNFKVACTFWYDDETFDVNFIAAEYILSSVLPIQ